MSVFLTVLLFAFIIFWLVFKLKTDKALKNLDAEILNKVEEKKKLEIRINELERRNQELNKYEGILEIDKRGEEIVEQAKFLADSLLSDAKIQLETAAISATEIKSNAHEDAKQLKATAQLILDNAKAESNRVIEDANIKAVEIAGDAYKALQNVSELERTAKAIKNLIEGYGNEYLKPTYSLLDDLAEEFGHAEAGEKLRITREANRQIIKRGEAAQCDYVEANRKETAINFVLDAFNGKVDSILSKVKKDNFGVLEQKIKDAYQIVNANGKAFRNAVITPSYLNNRLEELKWAIVTQELKWEEQEEQRKIKEQIREEEKARRDFEKAMKEAQKEEEMLKRLIEKAQKEVQFASDEQKTKFQLQLSELEEKLKIAEEKSQRAISMAQQTKSGNVYIISNIGSFGEDVFKIGMTRRLEPTDRIKELGDASVPFDFDVHAMIYSENAPALERDLHKTFLRLQMNKVNPRKEFFRIQLEEIQAEISKLGIDCKWTLAAEARQYRETLVLEEAMSKDKLLRDEWERYQLQVDPVSEGVEEIQL